MPPSCIVPGQPGGARAHGVTWWSNQQVLIRKMIKEVWQTVPPGFLMKTERGRGHMEELK